MAAARSNIRWKVAAIDKGKLPWCIPLPDGSSVDDLRRTVEIRENMLRQEAGDADVVVGIQLRLDGELCAVCGTDLLLDVIPEHTKGATFSAIHIGGQHGVVSNLPPSRSAAATAAAAATPEAEGAGWQGTTTPEPSDQPTKDLPSPVQVLFPTDPGSSCNGVPAATAGRAVPSTEAAADLQCSAADLRDPNQAFSSSNSPASSVVAMAVEESGRAVPVRSHNSLCSSQVFLPNGVAPSRAVAWAIEAVLAERAQASLDPTASASSTINDHHHHHTQPCSISPAGRQGEAGVQQTGTWVNEREMERERAFSSPPAAGKRSRGASSDMGGKGPHTVAAAPSSNSKGEKNFCAACSKTFIPSLRASFCCRACGKLFHGDCAGYARHKRQCPPPDWICPCCPNGERGPTEYDIHSSLRGKGTIAQSLGNQLWCPICLEDDRAPGSTKNDPGSKKCRDCGLRAHGRCMSGLEIRPEGRWPCHECRRRRDRVMPGNNPVWLRLKTARVDGGHAPCMKPMQAPLSC